MDTTKNQVECNPTTTGIVPKCGMLAVPYVPVQRSTNDSYQADKALARGTLFPGLDLPYRGMVNDATGNPTPLQELMAMGFAVQELGLYLDTHKDDKEAQAMFQKYNKLYGEGVAEYERRYGPLRLTSSDGSNWDADPWPWDPMEEPTHQTLPRQNMQTAAIQRKQEV